MQELLIERLKSTLLTLKNIQAKEESRFFGIDPSLIREVKASVYRLEKVIEDFNLGKICVCDDQDSF